MEYSIVRLTFPNFFLSVYNIGFDRLKFGC